MLLASFIAVVSLSEEYFMNVFEIISRLFFLLVLMFPHLRFYFRELAESIQHAPVLASSMSWWLMMVMLINRWHTWVWILLPLMMRLMLTTSWHSESFRLLLIILLANRGCLIKIHRLLSSSSGEHASAITLQWRSRGNLWNRLKTKLFQVLYFSLFLPLSSCLLADFKSIYRCTHLLWRQKRRRRSVLVIALPLLDILLSIRIVLLRLGRALRLSLLVNRWGRTLSALRLVRLWRWRLHIVILLSDSLRNLVQCLVKRRRWSQGCTQSGNSFFLILCLLIVSFEVSQRLVDRLLFKWRRGDDYLRGWLLLCLLLREWYVYRYLLILYIYWREVGERSWRFHLRFLFLHCIIYFVFLAWLLLDNAVLEHVLLLALRGRRHWSVFWIFFCFMLLLLLRLVRVGNHLFNRIGLNEDRHEEVVGVLADQIVVIAGWK